MRAVYISANLAVVALPEMHTTSYFAQKIVRFPQNSPGHYCPPDLLAGTPMSVFNLSCMTVLLSCIFGFSVTCIVTFCVPPFLPLDFLNHIIFFLNFFLLLLSILFLCNLGVLFVRVGFNCNSFSHSDIQSYYKLLTW